jgi:hypothetical protein
VRQVHPRIAEGVSGSLSGNYADADQTIGAGSRISGFKAPVPESSALHHAAIDAVVVVPALKRRERYELASPARLSNWLPIAAENTDLGCRGSTASDSDPQPRKELLDRLVCAEQPALRRPPPSSRCQVSQRPRSSGYWRDLRPYFVGEKSPAIEHGHDQVQDDCLGQHRSRPSN